MPKILINEIDKTTPGTPDGYSNYSVLIPGFIGRAPKESDRIRPDSNGVYMFSDVQDFLDTIVPVAPHYEVNGVTNSHYGNQMAYELLKQGYSVIYLPISKETCVETLIDGKTWEIFKDKSNYDFRFVSHGLLESSNLEKVEERIREVEAAINTLNAEILNNEDVPEADRIQISFSAESSETDFNLEVTDIRNELYSNLYGRLVDPADATKAAGLVDPETKEYYPSCEKAVNGVLAERRRLADAKASSVTSGAIDTVNANIANIAAFVAEEELAAGTAAGTLSGRGDCVALIELDENSYSAAHVNPEHAIINAIANTSNAVIVNGKYCAMTVPSVIYRMADGVKVKADGIVIEDPYAKNKKFPGAFHYLACFMNSLRAGYNEWYAAAGYTRGVSSYSVDHTTVTLGEIAINALEPRYQTTAAKFACNVIANFRGSYYLWGNRTAHQLGDANGDLVASHFLNIRQLCITIKKQLYVACRRHTFDPNSDTLWFNFVNAIKPTLERMKADQGIRDYKVMKVATDKKALLKAKIRIIPIEAVEDFDLEVSLEDSFGETTVIAAE
jgi:hypothetical protein